MCVANVNNQKYKTGYLIIILWIYAFIYDKVRTISHRADTKTTTQ